VDGSLGFLFAAMLVTWAVVFLYLVVLSGRLAALRRDLEVLKEPDSAYDEDETPSPSDRGLG
jgi:CcmD family protein